MLIKGSKKYINTSQVFHIINRDLAFKYKNEAWREPMLTNVESFDYSIHFSTSCGDYIYKDKTINSREEIQEMIKKISNPQKLSNNL